MDILRIKTIVTIVDQYYDIEINNGVTKGNKILENIIEQLNETNLKNMYSDKDIRFIVISIINSKNNRDKKEKKYLSSVLKNKNRNYKMNNDIISDLIYNLKENDNNDNRKKLKKKFKAVFNGKNINTLEYLYEIYFNSIIDNDITLLNMLIDSDIDVNAEDMNGNTGLHYAVLYGRVNVVMILLQNDVKYVKNNDGYKPIDLLKKNKTDLDNQSKTDLINLLEYRKNKTFKMNTGISLFGKHDNLININSEDELRKLKGAKGLLVFYMITCGWCKKMQNDIKMLCNRGTKVYIMESNYVDANLRQEYSINGFPTVYILNNGKQKKYEGSDRSYKTFEKLLK